MHYNILDEKRRAILPKLSELKSEFYLAGGTALALQIGHRDSVDFDFFTQDNIDTQELFEKVIDIFTEHKVLKTQEEHNTLSIVIDNNIRISFFTYKYPLIGSLIDEPYLHLAPIEDIACMKLSAITSRATNKDYIDLYFILKQMNLEELLELAKIKFPNLDTNLILKSLVYFDDLEEEPIVFKEDNETNWEEIKEVLKNAVLETQK